MRLQPQEARSSTRRHDAYRVAAKVLDGPISSLGAGLLSRRTGAGPLISSAAPCDSGSSGVYRKAGAETVVVDAADGQCEGAYERWAEDVFRFVLAWTNDWGDAEDLTQETFLRLWQHRAAIDWDRPIAGWLFVTARRLANNRFRALRRRIYPTRSELTPDESIRARWLDVRRALKSLTPLERTALILVTVEGWSYAEAANVLSTTDAALRAAVSRARDKLETA